MYSSEYYYFYCIDREDSSSNSGKGLLYAYNEYKALLDDYNEEDDSKVLEQLYLRMTKSLMCCLNSIDLVDSPINREYLDAYNWLKMQINKAIEMDILKLDDMSKGLRKMALLFLNSVEDYIQYKKEQEAIIKKAINGKKVIVFGCGNMGYGAYMWLKKHNHPITCFMDNNTELWNKNIDGIPILPPHECINYEKEVFMVANEKYYLEIINQLCDKGISKNRIFTLI